MDYKAALERAVLYIEANLEGDLRVEEVARQAGYSYYHLTRQFHALMGESVGSYVQKRRLAEAAQQLLYTDRRVLDIALSFGFGSGEAFSRAFKAAYRATPAAYRKNRVDTFMGYKHRMDTGRLHHIVNNLTPHPQIVEMPDLPITGLRGETTLQDNQIAQLWARFNAVAHTVPHAKPGARGIGLCESGAQGNLPYTMAEDVRFTEVAGLEVASFEGVKAPFVSAVVPGGRFAVFTHVGSIEGLTQTYEYIWGTWLLVTKEQLDIARLDFELYDERYTGYYDPESEMDIYIPIL